jgi:hypothetical protein
MTGRSEGPSSPSSHTSACSCRHVHHPCSTLMTLELVCVKRYRVKLNTGVACAVSLLGLLHLAIGDHPCKRESCADGLHCTMQIVSMVDGTSIVLDVLVLLSQAHCQGICSRDPVKTDCHCPMSSCLGRTAHGFQLLLGGPQLCDSRCVHHMRSASTSLTASRLAVSALYHWESSDASAQTISRVLCSAWVSSSSALSFKRMQ